MSSRFAAMNILVVDDEPSIRKLLRVLLEGQGHEVSEAANGAVALALALQHLPDLVLTDMMMPVMGGRELIERLRENHCAANIPIVVVSAGYDLAGLAVEATLPKPFAITEVLATVQAVADGGRK